MAEEKALGAAEDQVKKKKKNNYYRRFKKRNNSSANNAESSSNIDSGAPSAEAEAYANEEARSPENSSDKQDDSRPRKANEKRNKNKRPFKNRSNKESSEQSPKETDQALSNTEMTLDPSAVPMSEEATSDSSSSAEAEEKRSAKKRHSRKRRFDKRGASSDDNDTVSASNDETVDPQEEDAIPERANAEEETSNPSSMEVSAVEQREDALESTLEDGKPAEDPDLEPPTFVEIIGIRFRDTGKIYYFSPKEFKVSQGEAVIVETVRGIELGVVAIPNKLVKTSEIVSPLKTVVRIATEEDKKRIEENKKVEEKARDIFIEKVKEHKLSMTLVDVEYTFDNTKLLFYFTSEGRVDFRDLVKELASIYKTRIELRQIGVRDEAKQIGGLGICGRPFCCKTFLNDFQQVSIKMAKDQNLSLNSTKISGTCGRLMCCLRYENDVYEEESRKTPRVDSIVETPMGRGTVVETNVLLGMVKVVLEKTPEAAPESFHRSNVSVISSRKRDDDIPEDLKALEDKN